MRRLLLFDRGGSPLGELAEADVFEATLREEINGEHSLEITTTQVLEKGSRLLYQDGKSKWREFSVAGIDAEHASGNRAIGTYYCVWSVQEDLQGVTVSVMPGVQSPVTAGAALTSLLSTTNRWNTGTVTNTATGGASMYDRSAWEALSTLVEVWGGEIDVSITVDTNTGVTARLIDLYSKQGEQTAKRRFDFGHDLQSVKRTYTDEPLYCRISPRGAGEETDAGGYGRKITIESVNSGRDYLEYSPMVSIARLPNGSGGYEYPTLIVENSNCKTPTDLKTWAQSILEETCTPKVSYEVDVFQAGIEGVDFNGVSLGDAVQIVDQKFSPEGIRVEGRISSITTDILSERDITVKIGSLEQSISAQFENVSKSLSQVDNYITVTSTAEYIDELLDRINTEINSTGGYTYIVQGHGIRTYDVEVSDPLIGSEASKVVEIKGGTIRIADSKTSQGEWEWKTVFTSGHISADLVTAANITTGYIGNSSSGSYWDLDNNIFQIGTGAEIAGRTAGTLVSDVDDAKKVATNYLTYDSSNGLDVGYSGTSAKTRISGSGVEIFDNNGQAAFSAKVVDNESTSIVGNSSSQHAELSYRRFVLKDREQTPFFEACDLRGLDGTFVMEETEVTQSANVTFFDCSVKAISIQSVSYGSTDLTSVASIVNNGFGISVPASTQIPKGSSVRYVYVSNTQAAKYITLGTRDGNSYTAPQSFVFGWNNEASDIYAFAIGRSAVASRIHAVAIGDGAIANRNHAIAIGEGVKATKYGQIVIGAANVSNDEPVFIIGTGATQAFNRNGLTLDQFGNLWIAGTLTQNSDRRLKEHVSYLGKDACEFIRKLKPALFVKDGAKHLGFYAQDVEAADTWGTDTVTPDHTDESLDFDPLTLEYTALIAPLVAYAQSLEERIEELTRKIGG